MEMGEVERRTRRHLCLIEDEKNKGKRRGIYRKGGKREETTEKEKGEKEGEKE